MAALLAIAAFGSLGAWQLQRHAWRGEWLAARNAQIDLPPVTIAEALADPRAVADRRGIARGRLLPSESIAAHGPKGGVKILTPLLLPPDIAADALLLVDRGFVPGPDLESFLERELRRAPAEVEITGLLLPLAVQPVAPGAAAAPRRVWQRFDARRPDAVAALQAQLPRPLVPLLLEAAAGEPTELPRGGITRPTSPVDHRSYALFWFVLAAVAAAHWVGYGLQAGREAGRAVRGATLRAATDGRRDGGGEA